MDGFFSRAELTVRPPQSRIPKCDRCGLFRGSRTHNMPPSGRGRRRVLLCGEYNGWAENEAGVQFVGETGKFLESRLDRIGVDMRRDCWLTNALTCYGKGSPTAVPT